MASGNIYSENNIHDGQTVRLAARATGNFSSLSELSEVHFFINGYKFATDVGIPINSSDGNIQHIDYSANLDIDFSKYAKQDGSISIVAFGEMNDTRGYIPSFKSNQ